MERKRNELSDFRATVPMVDHNETNRIQIGNGKVKIINLKNFQPGKSDPF